MSNKYLNVGLKSVKYKLVEVINKPLKTNKKHILRAL